jgi:hypothetical protein
MGTGNVFQQSDEQVISAAIAKQLKVKNGKLFLGSKRIKITLPGEPGRQGQKGRPPEHEWDGTRVRFKNPDDTWGEWTELRGKGGKPGHSPIKGVDFKDGEDGADGYTPVKGKDYFDGEQGDPGEDGEDGTDGEDGKDGTDGVDGVGRPPAHRWQGTQLQFQNPDGSWGKLVDLAGKPGRTPRKDHDYRDGKDGEDGRHAVLPESREMTVLLNADIVLDTDGKIALKKRFQQIIVYPKE